MTINRGLMRRRPQSAGTARGASAPQRADVSAQFASAVALHQAGLVVEAERLYREALAGDPLHAEANCNLGVALKAQGRLIEAMAAYRRALALKPDYAQAHYNMGNALKDRGMLPEATLAFERAVGLDPNDFVGWNNLGNVLKLTGRLDEAIASYHRALALNPAYAQAHYNLGEALASSGRLADAAAAYRRALALRPDYPEAYGNLGVVLRDLGRLTEAEPCFRAALALKPSDSHALNNLGAVLLDQCRLDEAAACWERALALEPDYAAAFSNLLMSQHYAAGSSGAERLATALRFGAMVDETIVARTAFANDRTPSRRLRIGYVSGDFRQHPAGFFLSAVLEAHDRDAVELYCYSNDAKVDGMTNRLRRAADQWRVIAGMASAEAAALVAKDRIDILVDLSGHTAKNRLRLFALRPAPVQASWLGYFGTTGLAAMDYLVMDAGAVPPGEARWYREAVARLPFGRFCYAPPDDAPEVAAPRAGRRDGVTFGSFNNVAKINAEVVGLWAAVIAATPGSRLVLKWKSLDDEGVRRGVATAFAAAGVAEGRLELRGFSAHREMLAQYGEIDIALDPFPFGGGLTSCEALWMGAPIVTLAGDRPAARQTAGFLDLVGLADCIARTPAEYVRIAAALAADPARLADLRRSLRSDMARSPLCDGALFTPTLEAAYREMWTRWCAGEPARGFDAAGAATRIDR
ncbi:MAG: tetratricopeptide repeat protein [Roseiarcus sp.]